MGPFSQIQGALADAGGVTRAMAVPSPSDGAATDAMEAEVAARSMDSTDWHDDDAAVARRGASETEPGPKRHKAGQVTTDGGVGRATEAMDVVQMDGAGGKTKRSRRGKKKTGMCRRARQRAKAKQIKDAGGQAPRTS